MLQCNVTDLIAHVADRAASSVWLRLFALNGSYHSVLLLCCRAFLGCLAILAFLYPHHLWSLSLPLYDGSGLERAGPVIGWSGPPRLSFRPRPERWLSDRSVTASGAVSSFLAKVSLPVGLGSLTNNLGISNVALGSCICGEHCGLFRPPVTCATQPVVTWQPRFRTPRVVLVCRDCHMYEPRVQSWITLFSVALTTKVYVCVILNWNDVA